MNIDFRLLLFNVFIIIALIVSCSSEPINKKYSTSKTYSFTSNTVNLPKSNERIDNTSTYEFFFNLTGQTHCIDISIITQDKNGKRVRCAFIVEYLVNVLQYPTKPKEPLYTEIARNFDINWRMQTKVNICTNTADPLKRLNKGSYRLRVSAFSDDYFTFTVDITSPVAVEFMQ